ncbi:MAG: Gfo/Idh/MocA family oxidoreductase [Phycisphaerae bacterium]|nr:Gfo/Idh/MocA family oxidoreductase [Phycisphaerae bacterium]
MNGSSRRAFLRSSAAAAGATVLAAPSMARGEGGANDRIRVAAVGIRGRGRALMNSLEALAGDNVELAALCDCDEKILNLRAEDHEKKTGKKAARVADMRRILDDKSIDAVAFATPNHWHALGTVWACQAGKDVYVEKPGSHNIFEGRKMVEAARKYNRMVQHGTQCRGSANIIEGINKMKEGAIGRVYMARGIAYKYRGNPGRAIEKPAPAGLDWDKWLGPAPQKPYSDFRRNGHHILWDYGCGEIGNQGVHQLDMMRWGLGLETHPTKVQSMGGCYIYESDQETPSTQTFSCEFGDRKILMTFEVRNYITNSEADMGTKYEFVDHRNVVGVIFLGTKGYMIIPDYSSYHMFLGRERKPGPTKSVAGAPMMDTDHMKNWIEACRKRDHKLLAADILEGHMSAAICHLANIAYRTGRTVHFDPKTEQVVGDAEANAMIRREYRARFVVPDEV